MGRARIFVAKIIFVFQIFLLAGDSKRQLQRRDYDYD